MSDLRKAVEKAIEGFEHIHQGCGFVKETAEIHKDAKNLATLVRKDCSMYIKELHQMLPKSRSKTRE